MIYLFRLGFLNLLRKPSRAILSTISVIAGVAVFILGQGLVGGIKENIVRAQIDKVSSHVMVRPLDYPAEQMSHPTGDLFAITNADKSWLDANAVAWTPRVLFTPELIVGPDAIQVRGIAMHDRDASVFPRDEWLWTGDFPKTADDGVLVGKGVAKLLDIEAGDWVTLRARTTQGAVNALQVPVAGVVASGSPIIDSGSVLFPWALSDKLIQHGDRVSHLSVKIDDRDQADTVGAALVEQMAAPVEFVTWASETRELLRLQDIRQQLFDGLAFCLLLMSATGIANTVLMAAYERIREVGTLQAMGMTRQHVLALFIIEGGMLGLVGGLIGAGFGGAVIYYGTTHGIDLGPLIEQGGEAKAQFPFSTMLYTAYSGANVAWGLFIGVLMAVLASVYPAMVASQMQPADAVRA